MPSNTQLARDQLAHPLAVYSVRRTPPTVEVLGAGVGGLMAKRKKKGKLEHLFYLVCWTVLGFIIQKAVWPGGWYTALFVLVWFIAVTIWVLFFMPTRCHYDVGTHGCTWKVNGKLRGCHWHSQLKRDAIWAATKRRNPGLAMRITWGDHRPNLGHHVGTNPVYSDRNAETGTYRTLILWLTAIGTIATVISVLLAIQLKK